MIICQYGRFARQTSTNTSYNTTCKRLIQISPSPSPLTSTLPRSCLKLAPNLSRSSHLSMAILMAKWALPLQSRSSPTDRCQHCAGAAVSHGLIRAADEMRITLTIYSKTCKQYFGPKYLVGLIYISTKWDTAYPRSGCTQSIRQNKQRPAVDSSLSALRWQ